MAKQIGYIVGFSIGIRGLMLLVAPRPILERFSRLIRYPAAVHNYLSDFLRVSDTSLRLLGLWLTLVAAIILWLVSKLPNERKNHP